MMVQCMCFVYAEAADTKIANLILVFPNCRWLETAALLQFIFRDDLQRFWVL